MFTWIFFRNLHIHLILYLPLTVMMKLISMEKSLVLKFLVGSMTVYPIERYVSPNNILLLPQCLQYHVLFCLWRGTQEEGYVLVNDILNTFYL